MSEVSKEGIKTMPRGVVPGDRWAVLEKTSPSGKTMFRCMSCGHESPAPQKICTKLVVRAGEPGGVREPNVECMTWQPVKLFRYYLKSEKGEGWALIVLSNDGYFSAVSDYGNYSFWWSHHGMPDFRLFLLRAERDWDYFAGKLSHGKVYDGEKTYENVKRYILECRLEQGREENAGRVCTGQWTREFAREEWGRLHDDVEEVRTIADYTRWLERTEILEAWHIYAYAESYPGDVKAFCQKTLPRLGRILKEDLAREGFIPMDTTA